jgi:thiamine-phosphate pyrophosphorylase
VTTADQTALQNARLYLVAGESIGGEPTAKRVPELAHAGVDVLQLREKDAEAADVLRAGTELARACDDAGILFVVNDRPDLAALVGAGVHVGQNDVPVGDARRFVPGHVVGLSTHATGEIDAVVAAVTPPDYVAVGPLFETPTKPGRPAVGLELARYAAARVTIPWFAIGGIDETNVREVLDAGARRVVVVRAITEASDPAAAAARLRSLLDEVSL